MVISARTRVAGLFGHPVEHSLSPTMHNAAFRHLGIDYVYLPFDVSPENLEAAVYGIKALGIVGINVTIPHKNRIIGYLDWVDHDARMIESVNTIYNDNGILKGYSTDAEGFLQALKEAWKDPYGCNAVVIGAGGAARATVYALLKSGANVVIVNRTPERALKLVQAMKSINCEWSVKSIDGSNRDEVENAIATSELLVNCTPVGMYPNEGASPVPCELLHPNLFVFDQIYNPYETKLIKKAKEIGAKVSNGIMMLVYQGAMSFEIWTKCKAPIDAMKTAIL